MDPKQIEMLKALQASVSQMTVEQFAAMLTGQGVAAAIGTLISVLDDEGKKYLFESMKESYPGLWP